MLTTLLIVFPLFFTSQLEGTSPEPAPHLRVSVSKIIDSIYVQNGATKPQGLESRIQTPDQIEKLFKAIGVDIVDPENFRDLRDKLLAKVTTALIREVC